MKKIRLKESDLKKIIHNVLMEEDMAAQKPKSGKKDAVKPRCIPENVINLDEIVGQANDYGKYSNGVVKRLNGVNSLVDSLGILNNVRLFKDIKDGGAHLAYDMMNHLNKFRNKNYYDETTGECHKAMDKIAELYKESEHGTELVKDIEKILNLQTKDDEYTPSPRAKEDLKQCVNLVKGQ